MPQSGCDRDPTKSELLAFVLNKWTCPGHCTGQDRTKEGQSSQGEEAQSNIYWMSLSFNPILLVFSNLSSHL